MVQSKVRRSSAVRSAGPRSVGHSRRPRHRCPRAAGKVHPRSRDSRPAV